MPAPSFHINISGSVLALYGALVATATAIVQIVNFFRDRARIKVTVQQNMEMIGHPAYAGVTLTMIRAVNVGRRPVTITTIGAYRLHPSKAFVCADTTPALPVELTEGKYVTALIGQKDLDLENIESWQAWDSANRVFSLHVAPWRKRWRSRRMRRKSGTTTNTKAGSTAV